MNGYEREIISNARLMQLLDSYKAASSTRVFTEDEAKEMMNEIVVKYNTEFNTVKEDASNAFFKLMDTIPRQHFESPYIYH